METIVTIIFVQSIMWSMILLKKFNSEFKWLFGAFNMVFAVFFLQYLELVDVINVKPLVLVLIAVVALSLLTEYLLKLYHYGKAFRSISPVFLIVTNTLIFFLKDNVWQFYIALIPFLLLILYEVNLALRSIRAENFGSSPFEDKRFRLILSTLLVKLLFWVSSTLTVLLFQLTEADEEWILLGYFTSIAVGIFILGYLANNTDLKRSSQKREPLLPKDKEWSDKITALMEVEKPWLDCELTLSDLADQLGLSESELTIILNKKMQTSFYKLINSYRIEMVKSKLAEPSNKRFTILAAAYDSGFNSKSTFYRIFKEETGQTPKQYMDELKK